MNAAQTSRHHVPAWPERERFWFVHLMRQADMLGQSFSTNHFQTQRTGGIRTTGLESLWLPSLSNVFGWYLCPEVVHVGAGYDWALEWSQVNDVLLLDVGSGLVGTRTPPDTGYI